MGARPSSFKSDVHDVVDVAPVVNIGRQWSDQQRAIFDWFEQKWAPSGVALDSRDFMNPNLVVRARAGTGKTTTIVEGVNRAPEDFILVCAFNKKIADTLSNKCTKAEARTLHSLGYNVIRRQWSNMPVAKFSGALRSQYLTDQSQVIRRHQGGEILLRGNAAPKQVRTVIGNLHTKVREMGVDPTFDAVSACADEFDLTVDNGWGQHDQDFVVNAAISAVEHATKHAPKHDIGIDYADMIFLPLVWKLLTPDYQLVVVDEAQDMTMNQLEMAQRSCCGRICIVGDDKQAIYGFRGADSGSLDRLKGELSAAELPLHTTYRCAQIIVREAQRLVPDIYAAPSNPEGTMDDIGYSALYEEAQPGQFILSRINAPLVSITLGLIRREKRARMAGRDIGGAVKAVIEKICRGKLTMPIEDMLDLLNEWESRTVTRYANSGKLDLVDKTHDQADTIRALAEDSDDANVGSLIQTLAWLFEKEDEMNPATTIICSSVHKAKGLEADRVYILPESFYRRGVTPEEQNIEYVAITRAKSHLTSVWDVPGLTRREKREDQ